MEKICSLDRLGVGYSAEVIKLENAGSIRRRLLDMGITEGSTISCVLRAPLSEPCAYLVKGAVIAIRKNDSKKIM